jgi:hypothetical protein
VFSPYDHLYHHLQKHQPPIMGACVSALTPKRVAAPKMLSDFKIFLDVYCEIDERYHMPMAELCAAFWQYAKYNMVQHDIGLSDLKGLVNILLTMAKKEYGFPLEHRGIHSNKTSIHYAYISGIRLRVFPGRRGICS